MNENVDIFICAHKDFDKQVSNSVYKVLDTRDIKASGFRICGILDDVALSELYSYQWLSLKPDELKDYVGFCHYRRYYEFMDDVPNIEELFNEYDTIIRTPLQLKLTNLEQYALCHNIEDINLLGEILKDKFNEYYAAYNAFINSRIFIPCNMFIMRKEDFLKYTSLMKEVMKEYFWRWGIDFRNKVVENEEKYLKNAYPNSSISYQERVFSFVFERLTNVFIFKNFKRLKMYNVVVTENKYNLKNNTI